MKHWRHHPDDETLEPISFEVFQTLTQSLVEHFKELLMAAIEDVLTAAAATDQAASAYIADLQAQLAAAQVPDPNVQTLADALDTANSALQALLPAPAPADTTPATNPDGSTTNPDGSVTNADGTVTPAPAV